MGIGGNRITTRRRVNLDLDQSTPFIVIRGTLFPNEDGEAGLEPILESSGGVGRTRARRGCRCGVDNIERVIPTLGALTEVKYTRCCLAINPPPNGLIIVCGSCSRSFRGLSADKQPGRHPIHLGCLIEEFSALFQQAIQDWWQGDIHDVYTLSAYTVAQKAVLVFVCLLGRYFAHGNPFLDQQPSDHRA